MHLKDIYESKLEELGLIKIKDRVLKEVDKIPLTLPNKDYFFKYAYDNKLNDFQIIEKLLRPQWATFEHIIPSSNGGKKHVDNGLVLCHRCNSARSQMSYIDWLRYHPQMPYNTQKQILKISQLILDGKLDDSLNFYPVKIAKTLQDVSDGKIKLDISEYSKKASRRAEKRISEKTDSVDKLCKEQAQMKDEIVTISKQLVELLERKESLERKVKDKSAELDEIMSEISNDMVLKDLLKEYSEK